MRNKIIPYDPALKCLAQRLRKESTLSEILLWKQIKNRALGLQFHRQVPIDKFIVDFYCHEIMLAIEIDGNSHYDLDKDNSRQAQLEKLGVRFIRFADHTVKNEMNAVTLAITDMIDQLRKS
jgi:very-short-patch-repair endonuclease